MSVHVYVGLNVYVCIRVCMDVCVNVYVCARACVCVRACVRACVCVCVCLHMQTIAHSCVFVYVESTTIHDSSLNSIRPLCALLPPSSHLPSLHPLPPMVRGRTKPVLVLKQSLQTSIDEVSRYSHVNRHRCCHTELPSDGPGHPRAPCTVLRQACSVGRW